VKVLAEPSFEFRCIATDVRPVSEVCPSPDGLKDGVDYIAVCPGEDPSPILGFAQSCDDTSAYALLLRALTCLAEFAPATRLDQLNRDWLKGMLPEDPRFEVHLVLWDESEFTAEESTLCELGRSGRSDRTRSAHSRRHDRLDGNLRQTGGNGPRPWRSTASRRAKMFDKGTRQGMQQTGVTMKRP